MTSSVVETLVQRNAEFAKERYSATLKMMPSLRTLILGCVDPRVDPGEVLGMQPGEAAIIRNVGGRVTPATLETLAMLRQVTRAAGGDLGAGWTLVLLHHTDCGITRLHSSPALLSAYLGTAEDQLSAQAIDDPRASVAHDIELLRAAPGISAELQVSGLVYDVLTGRVATVVTAAPLRA